MPVGQAVIATIDFALGRFGLCGAAAAGRGLRRRRGLTTPSTRPTTSSADFAAAQRCDEVRRTRARARLDSSFMCSAPAPSGAAIRNTRSAGPSGAPKSTVG